MVKKFLSAQGKTVKAAVVYPERKLMNQLMTVNRESQACFFFLIFLSFFCLFSLTGKDLAEIAWFHMK